MTNDPTPRSAVNPPSHAVNNHDGNDTWLPLGKADNISRRKHETRNRLENKKACPPDKQ